MDSQIDMKKHSSDGCVMTISSQTFSMHPPFPRTHDEGGPILADTAPKPGIIQGERLAAWSHVKFVQSLVSIKSRRAVPHN